MYCKHPEFVLSWVLRTSHESIKYKTISVLSCVFPNEAIFAEKIILALLPVRVIGSDLKGDNGYNSVHYSCYCTSLKTSLRHPLFGFFGCCQVIQTRSNVSFLYHILIASGVSSIEICLIITNKHVITLHFWGQNMLILRWKGNLKSKWEFKFK